MRYVKDADGPTIFLFKDLGPHCKDPQIVRALRDLYFSPDSRLGTLVLLDAVGLPPEVLRLTVPFEVGWPSEEELLEIVRSTFQDAQHRSLEKIESKLTKRELELLVQTLQGLTTDEAARVVTGAIYDHNILDGSNLPRIVDAKRTAWAAWRPPSIPYRTRLVRGGCGVKKAKCLRNQSQPLKRPSQILEHLQSGGRT